MFGAFRQAKEPIGGDAERCGAFGDKLGIGEPGVLCLEELRDGGAILMRPKR